MINKFLDWILGGNSRRYQLTLLYTIIYVLLQAHGKLDPISFATFSGVFGVWIVGSSIRQ